MLRSTAPSIETTVPAPRSRLSESGDSVARTTRITAATTHRAATTGRKAALGAGPVEVINRTAMTIAPTARYSSVLRVERSSLR